LFVISAHWWIFTNFYSVICLHSRHPPNSQRWHANSSSF